ncbi:MAG: ABC transporter substrate-binding protein/permease [Lachnospiraceae bacterium]|nr:ABC transporter substrate-binding protein/permease [Lachnospiraceae bacterium]
MKKHLLKRMGLFLCLLLVGGLSVSAGRAYATVSSETGSSEESGSSEVDSGETGSSEAGSGESGSIELADSSDEAGSEASGESSESGSSEAIPEFSDFSDLDGKRVSMLSGAPFSDQVDKYVDGAKYTYYDSFADIILALKSGKTDAALNNSAVAEYQANQDPALVVMEQPLQEMEFGIAFKKGSPEVEKWQKAIEEVGEEEINRLWDIWIGSDESKKILPEQDWPGNNGTVKVAIIDNLEPMGYRGDNESIVGFDPALLLTVAKQLDVKVEFKGMELAALLPSVESGKADLAIGSMLITGARLESMDMVPYHSGNVVLLVRARDQGGNATNGFLTKLKASFRKTFIDERRYKLIFNGLLVTLIISIVAGLLGVLLGFGIVFLNRLNNKVINVITRILEEIVVGLPAVVILMVLYYIIFGKAEISAVIVAIIGFSIMFGIKTFDIIINAIKAVDPGQMEAALSLGYKEGKAFRRIILPQARDIYFPLIKTQFVVMIKDTSIVGFIAVMDLTRAGDLIRSRTLEAFFPLITIAIFYYILIKLLSGIINLIYNRFFEGKKEKSKKELGKIIEGRGKS